jgi:lipopolysaccharide transport system permease protein/teichoic acid transport system permease protein
VTTAAREVMSRRRLIRYLVMADIRKKGTDTLLGNLWWIMDPIIAMAIYVFVMGVIFQRNVPDFPVYILAAVIPFKWFTQGVADATGAVVQNEKLIKQIQFPKIVLVISGSSAEVVNFLFGAFLLVVLSGIWAGGAHLSIEVLWIPVIAAVQYTFMLGIGLIVAATTVFYRDVGIVVNHLLRMLFFVSPILWSFDAATGRGAGLKEAVGARGFWVLEHNPVAILLTAYRHVVYGVVTVDDAGNIGWSAPIPPDLGLLAALFVVSVVFVVFGTWYFKRLEPAFAKVL